MNIEKTERQFSERLANHQAFDLDADLTWKAIESELDKKKKKRNILLFFSIGTGCLIGLLAMYSLFVRSEVSVNQVDNDQHPSTIRSYSSQQQSVRSIADAFQIVQLKQSELPAIPGRFQYAVIQETYFSSQNTDPAESGKQITQNTDAPLAVSPKHSLISLGKEAEKAAKTVRNQELIKYLAEVETETSIQNRTQVTTVPLLESSPLHYLIIPKEQVPIKRNTNTVAAEIPKPAYQLEAAAMLFKITNGLHAKNGENDDVNLRKHSETPQVSWSVAGNLWRTNPSGWLTGIGVEYRKTWVKFRYQEDDTNSLLLENIPIHYLIDAHTQDTAARQIGDVNVNQHNKRDVQHFNSFQTLSLPVHFGFIKPGQQKITYGLVGGLRFQYHLKQSGRLLTESATITTFSDDSYFRRTGLSAHLAPVLILKSGTHWQFSCRLSVSYALLNNVKAEVGILQRPFTYGLSLGIRRKL